MPPVALRTEPLGIRKIYDLLTTNDVDAVMQRDRIEVMDRDIIIKNEKDILVVEGNASVNFQKIQRILTEQYSIVQNSILKVFGKTNIQEKRLFNIYFITETNDMWNIIHNFVNKNFEFVKQKGTQIMDTLINFF